MTVYLQIHPDDPQPRHLVRASEIVREGGVIAFPTDSCYALGCHLGDKDAVDRIRAIREVDERHHLTLMCRDLSEIATYARVDNQQYRLLKLGTPGPFTFILEATKEVPRRVSHPSRRTIGLRVPEHPVCQGLLEQIGEPLLATTLILSDHENPLNDAQDIREALDKRIQAIVDAGACTMMPTTVIDLSKAGEPELVRQGRGDLSVLGLG